MSNARQGSVSHKFFEMVEAHKDDLAELHLRREIERMLNDYFKLFELHCVEGEYFIYDAFSYTTQGPYTLQQCHDKLREISGGLNNVK